MASYKDSKVSIANNKITIKGIILPFISHISMEGKDIVSIREVNLSPIMRMNMLGTQNLKTWWCFDEFRFLRKKAIILTLTESLGPLNQIGFTVKDHERAMRVIKAMFPELVY